MSATETPLADAAARRRITERTDETLFIEAGAGSGKTRALVDRICQLVLVDGVPLTSIAAVTFTEKAGAELRDRLRTTFEKRRREAIATIDEAVRDRADGALDDLDTAAIGTLHSFAQRLLAAYPIQAGLPPLVEVLDEVASSVAFEDRWAVMRRAMLDDEDLASALQLALAAHVKLDHLRSLARALGSDWDLAEERIIQRDDDEPFAMPDVGGLAAEAAALAARASECTDESDKFLERLAGFGAWSQQLTEAADEATAYAVLLAAADLPLSYGRKGSWPDLAGLKASCQDVLDRAEALAGEVSNALLRPLTRWLARATVAAAEERAASGRLEFHDLLVLSRRLLRHHAEARAELQHEYRYLLLDEFQDTDPIQIELAVRIAGGAQAGVEDAPEWTDVEVPPGALFVVGDPKQSIYRFRRADIAMYLRAQEWFGRDAHAVLETNFRTVPSVLKWVNEVFAQVIRPEPAAQPEYQPLLPHRRPLDGGPAVTLLGRDEHDFPAYRNAARLKRLEAEGVAAAIRRALAERWSVHDEVEGERDVRLSDIAILLPSRTSLPALETALEDADIPYRTESSSLVYQAPEVHELLIAARAIADPSDLFSCVMALRSPLFGCGDDDLWTWKHSGGSFHLLAPTDEVVDRLGRPDHPVASGLEYLRRLHYRARWMTPSEVLGALVGDRRVYEVAAGRPRARDHWRRLRFVVDQARAWSEAQHGGLRGYLAWAAKQSEETARVAEAVLPETDVEAVRIMTVHAAKGLEFPVVMLSGMTTQPRNQSGVQLLWPRDGGWSVRLTKQVQSYDFTDAAELDEQMDEHERRRLLYVATTRARDHLVVSLHRGQKSPRTNAVILAEGGACDAAGAVAFEPGEESALHDQRPAEPTAPAEWHAWRTRLQAVRDASGRPSAVSASGLEGTEPEVALEDVTVTLAGQAKGARDADLPPWVKGRYGSAIGRAVHGVLQTIDLATGHGLEQAVAAQSLAEGVADEADHVQELVRNALLSQVVRRAAVREHWRETYVGLAQEDGTVLEGFVDLVYREDDGTLVIVDYKTDDVPASGMPARVDYYRPQIAAYQHVMSSATGIGSRGELLFLATTEEISP